MTQHSIDHTCNKRCGLGQAVTNIVDKFRVEQELLHLAIEFRASDTEETDTTAEGLCKFLACNAVQVTANKAYAIERIHKAVRGKHLLHLTLKYLLDNKRYGKHNCWSDLLQCRQQYRNGWSLIEIDNMRSVMECKDKSERTFVGVRHRQYREEYIVFTHKEQWVNQPHLRCEVVVRKHYSLWSRCCTRSVDNSRQIFGLWHCQFALLLHILRENREVFGTNNNIQLCRNLLRDFGKELIRNAHSLCLRVLNDTVEVCRCKIGQYRDYRVASRSNSKVANAPIRHIATEQDDLIALFKTCRAKQLLYLGYLFAHLLIGVARASPQRKGYTLRKILNTIVQNFVKCIQLHKVVKKI